MESNDRDFASYLDAAARREMTEQPEAEDDTTLSTGHVPFDYLAVADELHSGRIQVQADRRRGAEAAEPYRAELEAYLDAADILEDVSPVAAEAELSVDADDIAVELGLEQAGPTEFARIRRSFAFANHPDRVAPHLRERAMLRMQVANMLIDDARSKAGVSTRL